MNDDSGFIYFPRNRGDDALTPPEPCLLDCPANDEIVTLIVDRANPQYLFVSLGGEMRRCYDLSSHHLSFQTRQQAISFLESLRDSEFFTTIIEEEQSLDRDWDSL